MEPPLRSIDETSDRTVDEHRRWLHAVFDRYHRPLMAYAYRLLNRDTERAQDCVQDTFLALCQQPRSSVDGHIDAWLFKSCRNRAMDHHRQESQMKNLLHSASCSLQSPPIDDPTLRMQRTEEQTLVEQQIQLLPARQQELLELRLAHGMSYQQIAEITGLSSSNVGFILHQALVSLKTALASE